MRSCVTTRHGAYVHRRFVTLVALGVAARIVGDRVPSIVPRCLDVFA